MKNSRLIAGFVILTMLLVFIIFGGMAVENTPDEYNELAFMMYIGFTSIILALFAIFVALEAQNK